MKKSLLIIVSILTLIPLAKASHVVGGDFQITMVSQNANSADYQVKLRAYRDDVNGIPMPASITVGVYDAVTHAPIVTQVLNKTNAFTLVPLGDPCYTPDPNVVRIEEGIFEGPSTINLPNNPNGYYISGKINARNSLALNVQVGGTMTWFAMIPDPAIGQNSSPDFGDYPSDAYFCISSPRIIQFPVIDVDGDSLAYSLVEPFNAWSAANGTEPGQGAYPYYPSLNWQATYSLANIVGGATPMSINPQNGQIFAAPSLQGFWTYAVRVEEFRDTTAAQNGPKVKIGEVRRDLQYASFNCTGGAPPTFLNTVPVMNQTIQIDYNKEYCKDLIFDDINATDTVYIEMLSPVFDSGAYQTYPPTIGGNQTYYYDWNGTAWNDSVVIAPNQMDSVGEWNIGTVAVRFCWTPGCDEVGKTFPFQVNAFSLGCDGRSQDSILFNLEVVPPPANLAIPGPLEYTWGNNQCINVVFQDSTIVDNLDIVINSSIFSLLEDPAEFPSLPNNYVYESFSQAPIVTGVPNDAVNQYVLGTQFCWYPACERIYGTFPVEAILYSVDCPEAINDTINFDISILEPFDSLGIVPNVITPNGDNMNDTYKISGVSNPCWDVMSVEIFNRWGILIYESDDPEFEWDGKNKSGAEVPAGTYFVLVHGTFGNETVSLDQRMVTVMR